MSDKFFDIVEKVNVLVSDYLSETDETIFLVQNQEREAIEKIPKTYSQNNKQYHVEITSVEEKSMQDLPREYFSTLREELCFPVLAYKAKTLIRVYPEKEKSYSGNNSFSMI